MVVCAVSIIAYAYSKNAEGHALSVKTAYEMQTWVKFGGWKVIYLAMFLFCDSLLGENL